MRAARLRPIRGFTLVEILVAMAIFSLIGVAAHQVLLRVLAAEERAAERTARLDALQRAVLRLERDVIQYVDRGVRDALGDPQPALMLEDGRRLELTRRGWRNPLGLKRSRLQRVTWRRVPDGGIERAYWSVLDRAEDSEPRRQRVLPGGETLTMRVIDAEGERWEFWPPRALPPDGAGTEAPPPPVALEVALRMPPFGEVVRVLRLASPAPQSGSGEAAEDGGNDAGTDDAADSDTAAGDGGAVNP